MTDVIRWDEKASLRMMGVMATSVNHRSPYDVYFVLSFFDPAHLPNLLKADAGAVISLPSELHHEYVLYQVEEIYKGTADDARR